MFDPYIHECQSDSYRLATQYLSELCGKLRKTLVQKLQHSGVPPNQIIQITGHKNLQSVHNYSSLREKQMESISRILSSTTITNVAQTENNWTAQPLAEYRIASTPTTSSILDVNSFNENRL